VAKSFKDYQQEGWSKKASQYERVTLPLTSRAFEPILASFGDLTGKRLLDVCTGPGHLAGEAAARGALVDAIDFSEAMVREARARFSGIGFMEGDAEALPYDDVSFDAVACCFGRRRLTSIQNDSGLSQGLAGRSACEDPCVLFARNLRPQGDPP
jgi:ubiquinone/menaquinone biosynthesis C-methylase UbiE